MEYMFEEKKREENAMRFNPVSNRFMPSSKAIFMHVCTVIRSDGGSSLGDRTCA